MEEKKRGMMRGGMLGDSDEQAITMIDRAKETGVRDGGSFQLNRDEMSERESGRLDEKRETIRC